MIKWTQDVGETAVYECKKYNIISRTDVYHIIILLAQHNDPIGITATYIIVLKNWVVLKNTLFLAW